MLLMKLKVGCHVSYKKDDGMLGSVKEAISYGCNTFMFYTGAPQNTFRSDIDEDTVKRAIELMKNEKIDINDVVIHAPYIVNLANDKDESKFNFAVNFLKQELERASMLGICNVVLHPGSHVGLGGQRGLDNIIRALNMVLDEGNGPIICLETMAGKGSELGKTFQELSYIINNVKNSSRLGVCLDTCHLNDAGYDMSMFDNVLDEFDKIIGIDRIRCIHINDSKNGKNSHKDRHENIGFGTIGFKNLINIIYNERISSIPKILET